MKYSYLRNTIVVVLFLLIATSLLAQNWPQWRGPEGNGVVESGNFPANISLPEAILWQVELPGAGGSTPIIWEDRIILTSGIGSGEEGQDGVLCYDWDGNLKWKVELGTQIPGKHPRGGGSNPSAVTDGERIFVLFKTTTLAALDFEGKVLWKVNLQDSYGEITFWWDFGTSPVLAHGNVVLAIMNEGKSYLLALDQATGKQVWKTDRNYTCSPESAQSYTTPLVMQDGQQTTILVWGADHLTGYDASTGELIWSYSGFNPGQKQYWRTIASPVVCGSIAVVPYGRGRNLAGMSVDVEGELTDKDFLWTKSGVGSDVASPVAVNGKVYILSFDGKLACLDIHSGEEDWKTDLPEVKGLFYSSPTWAGNRLYLCNDEGSFYVCELGEGGMKVLSLSHFDDNFVASPVLVRDRILLRGTKNLYCIGTK